MFELKVGNQWVCWNSFDAWFYLGKRNCAERFMFDFHKGQPQGRGLKASELFPLAKLVWVKGE